MKLDQVVPFGRSLTEYEHMFVLSKADLQKRSSVWLTDLQALMLKSLLKTLKEEQYETSIEIVPYELQRGGNEMLGIS